MPAPACPPVPHAASPPPGAPPPAPSPATPLAQGPRQGHQRQCEATQRQTLPLQTLARDRPCRRTAASRGRGSPAQEVVPRSGLDGRGGHRRPPTPRAPGPECRTRGMDCPPNNAGQQASSDSVPLATGTGPDAHGSPGRPVWAVLAAALGRLRSAPWGRVLSQPRRGHSQGLLWQVPESLTALAQNGHPNTPTPILGQAPAMGQSVLGPCGETSGLMAKSTDL